MNLPIIRVEDNSTTPALTLLYVCGANELDLKDIYADIYRLSEHPGRARLDPNSVTREVTLCNHSFLDLFWTTAASLLDYFADFFATDTALMQSIWFHLLDTWQAASPLLLYRDVIAHRCTSSDKITVHSFLNDYKATIALVHTLSSTRARARPDEHAVSTIHCPSGAVHGLTAWYNTGPYISGLKPWQQFLCNGAPGFQPGTADNGDNTAHAVELKLEPDKDKDKEKDKDKDILTRYLPQPAIGLIQAHTARARHLLTRYAEDTAAAADVDALALLAHMDATALPLPNTTSGSYTRTSMLSLGRSIAYELQRGAPPVQRYEGVGDASMMVERPDGVLLDEAVGSCKGREAYVPMTGPIGQAGVGFDVWCVTESRDALGWNGGGGGGGGEEDGETSVLTGGLGDMFDDWHFENEDES